MRILPSPAAGDTASQNGLPLKVRLVLAQGIVLAAGLLTATIVAAVVGPPLFHQHLIESGHPDQSPELVHIEEAYTSASTASLISALVIALAAATAVTWYLTRRLTAPLAALATAASQLSEGTYAARVPPLGAGPELDRLAATFNEMAERLQSTEDTRRRLLTDLAHELRTPVATIGAYVDGLDDQVTQWTPTTAAVLRDQTARLARLATDIDDVSRAEEHRLALRPAPLPVHGLIWAATQAVRDAYRSKGVNLISTDRDLHHANAPAQQAGRTSVTVDRDRMLQALTNLLTNALRHTPAGGTVSVDVNVDGHDRMVHVTVIDDGEGIPAGQLPHIFERFYRGDTARSRDHQGSGIGLTIARSIALAHDGTLEASSAGAGHGSRFVLSLPVTTTPATGTARRTSP